ncbi:putative galacturonosyltransferase 7 [Nymphaea thermarum]|nr:putative galacturonosyltransferase 7 [Nymphaea thermarum]
MKAPSVSAKKGVWNKFTTGVMGLVVLSLLVPLIFSLGGLHGKVVYSGSGSERRSTALGASSSHLEELVDIFSPSTADSALKNILKEENATTLSSSDINGEKPERNAQTSNFGGQSDRSPNMVQPPYGDMVNKLEDGVVESNKLASENSDQTDKSCEDTFGSYCLWCREHKVVMRDSIIKKLKDRLFMARAYYPSIAKKNQTHEKLSLELRQNIQEFERTLSDATTDGDLRGSMELKIQNMEVAIAKAEAEHVDCYNVDKKLAQILDMTKDEALFHRRQSAFLYHLGGQTIPKSHHCLSMRLTVEYFKSHMDHAGSSVIGHSSAADVHHYVIFSKNILASSVVINSTVTNGKENGRMVFHLLTDNQNYFAMKQWFENNNYKLATIYVENMDSYKLEYTATDPSNMLHPSASEEFRVTIRSNAQAFVVPRRTEYLSMFSQAYFYLPEVFSNLKRIIVLDDDVVVQRDLSPLWSLDLEGKVIGAQKFCRVRLAHLRGYLNTEGFNYDGCVWMSGLSIVDLERWRELHLFHKYQEWLKKQKKGEPLFRAGALSASLVTFNGLIYSLDDSWVLSGLGHQYGIDSNTIGKAAVLHYNGNMKPWLELGIPQYKWYWTQFLKKDDQYMDDCNVNR